MTRLAAQLVKSFLIIAMVVQPVTLAYAMASMGPSMNHGMHQTVAVAETMQAEQHHQHDTSKQTQQVDEAEMMSDCCSSAACCPAAVTMNDLLQRDASAYFSAVNYVSWEGIDLPAEVKPPRPFLG